MAARMNVSTGKMTKVQEQVQCVLWLAELQSVTSVQLRFRTRYGCHPPTRKSIRLWDNKLRTTGNLLRVKSSGKPRTSDEKVDRIREAFQRSPRKSVRVASLQLQILRSTET
ncbi:hypothetical protein C0J52_19636 [Blattella germanica]|nr:hypothetical protein C0J52_19636 [Blattella germanica]